MARPKFFRDPIHLQIRFAAANLADGPGDIPGERQISWTLQSLIDTEPFQRLRHVRQNGLANLVFHGAEHSRFAHSMGVSHLARVMFERLCRNSSIAEDPTVKLTVAAAGLVHDVGHGPFSHTIEEILRDNSVNFHHEQITKRFIVEEGSEIYKTLNRVDPSLPSMISKFFDKRARTEDTWIYKIISSQMDADRLDYVQRDAQFAGIRGHGFDIERLFDLIFISNDRNIAVDRGAIEAVEAYLVTLDQIWRAVYYHHAVRAATRMLGSLVGRAFGLSASDKSIFPDFGRGLHPLLRLFREGSAIALPEYLRLTDASIWMLVDGWRDHKDPILSDLANRLVARQLFKTIPLDPSDIAKCHALIEKARKITQEIFPQLADTAAHYVLLDSPDRTSYKFYDWKPEEPSESIWLTGGGKGEMPIEADGESTIIEALRRTRHFDRLIVLPQVRDKLIG